MKLIKRVDTPIFQSDLPHVESIYMSDETRKILVAANEWARQYAIHGMMSDTPFDDMNYVNARLDLYGAVTGDTRSIRFFASDEYQAAIQEVVRSAAVIVRQQSQAGFLLPLKEKLDRLEMLAGLVSFSERQ